MDPKTILIVDDNQTVRVNIRQILKKNNYHVVEAGDGPEMFTVLDKMLPKKPHLFLMDVVLPGPDGLQLIARLKEDSRFKSIPVVLLTGHATRQVVESAMNLGVLDLVVKPVQRESLLDKVSRAFITDRRMKLMSHMYSVIMLMVSPENLDDEAGAPPFPEEAVQEVIHQCFRTTDSVIRVTPQSYVIVLPATNKQGAQTAVSRLDKALESLNAKVGNLNWFHSHTTFP